MADENTTNKPWSLEQIIAAQIDEPSQKSCIYRIEQKSLSSPGNDAGLASKFTQIRVKSIEFIGI